MGETFMKALIALLALLAAAPALAETWPSRPVKVVVPYGPGGSADTTARLFADRLSQKFGQQFVVENRVGASGVIGTEAAARAAPDGYTMLLTPFNTLAIVPFARKTPYDPVKDFVPVGRIADVLYAMGVRADHPAKTLAEFIALAKQNPGKFTFGSSGIATTMQFSGEVLAEQAKIELTHVPYKGGGEAVADLVSGQVDVVFEGAVFPFYKSGKVRILGVIMPERHPDYPEIPAIREVLPGYEMANWFGVLLPARTPPEIARTLADGLNEIALRPDVQSRLLPLGIRARADTPADMAADIRHQSEKFGAMIQRLGIRLD
jgi:tripartite-type tricarboxylate transporter receptor subunit TctC